MAASHQRNYFLISIVLHSIILLVLVLGFNFSAPMAVIENTNKQDVISAVVLGDTVKSKILPEQSISKPAQKLAKVLPEKIPPKEVAKPIVINKPVISKKIIEKNQRDLFAKDLLADIRRQKDKKNKLQQKQLQSQFKNILRAQAEKSLRQQLLNETIKLSGKQTRQAQGIIDKYKALILQAISEHWVIPIQANKKLSSLLLIRLAPGGLVLDVQIIKSSGDPALDSSARAAIFKASPLPVPTNANEWQIFQQFVLKMTPANVVAGSGV